MRKKKIPNWFYWFNIIYKLCCWLNRKHKRLILLNYSYAIILRKQTFLLFNYSKRNDFIFYSLISIWFHENRKGHYRSMILPYLSFCVIVLFIVSMIYYNQSDRNWLSLFSVSFYWPCPCPNHLSWELLSLVSEYYMNHSMEINIIGEESYRSRSMKLEENIFDLEIKAQFYFGLFVAFLFNNISSNIIKITLDRVDDNLSKKYR